MNDDEQQGVPPLKANVWDIFALLAHFASEVFLAMANLFNTARVMLEDKATFVEDEKSFHEYAALTIEIGRAHV